MSQLNRLFEPGHIGKLEIKNRIVMAPMGVSYATDPGGFANQRFIDYYVERAKGGVGLIITSTAHVVAEAPFLPGLLGIYSDNHIPLLKNMAEVVKANGARIAVQLFHPGRRTSEYHPQLPCVSASTIPYPITGVVPRSLSISEISKIVDAYGDAGKRAKIAGFDAVEIHGAHGYLPNQFLSPWSNYRNDEYGRSVKNRARFACEIIKSIKSKAGADFPVIFRMDGEDGIEGGIKINEAIEQAGYLIEAGADALHISSGIREGHHWQFPTLMQQPGCLTHLSAAIKKAVKVPVIAVGRLGNPFVADEVLREGKADFIAMGRQLLADPALPNKARDGKFDEIRPCICCNIGCLFRSARSAYPLKSINLEGKRGSAPSDYSATCAVNPMCGHENDMQIKPAVKSKKVLVIGGGVGGMEAACTLAERGHQAHLYEKSNEMGGQWNIVAAYQPDVGRLINYFQNRLSKAGVKIFKNTTATAEQILAEKPDAVVVATGAKPIVPSIPGVNGKNVVLATDVLTGRVETGVEAVIIGGGSVGLDVAYYLLKKGKRPIIIEKLPRIGAGMGSTTRMIYKEIIIDNRVPFYTNAEPLNINENGINIMWDKDIEFIKADSIILAMGFKPDTTVANSLRGLVKEVYQIGDCIDVRNVNAAIHEAAYIGRII